MRRGSIDNVQCLPAPGRRLASFIGTDLDDPRLSANWPKGQLDGQRLFFYTIKRRIFFSARRKEDGGFEAAVFTAFPRAR